MSCSCTSPFWDRIVGKGSTQPLCMWRPPPSLHDAVHRGELRRDQPSHLDSLLSRCHDWGRRYCAGRDSSAGSHRNRLILMAECCRRSGALSAHRLWRRHPDGVGGATRCHQANWRDMTLLHKRCLGWCPVTQVNSTAEVVAVAPVMARMHPLIRRRHRRDRARPQSLTLRASSRRFSERGPDAQFPAEHRPADAVNDATRYFSHNQEGRGG
jgi:hypothetical protein